MLGILLGCLYMEFKPFVSNIQPLSLYGLIVIFTAIMNIAIPTVNVLELVHVFVFITQMAWFLNSTNSVVHRDQSEKKTM